MGAVTDGCLRIRKLDRVKLVFISNALVVDIIETRSAAADAMNFANGWKCIWNYSKFDAGFETKKHSVWIVGEICKLTVFKDFSGE